MGFRALLSGIRAGTLKADPLPWAQNTVGTTPPQGSLASVPSPSYAAGLAASFPAVDPSLSLSLPHLLFILTWGYVY